MPTLNKNRLMEIQENLAAVQKEMQLIEAAAASRTLNADEESRFAELEGRALKLQGAEENEKAHLNANRWTSDGNYSRTVVTDSGRAASFSHDHFIDAATGEPLRLLAAGEQFNQAGSVDVGGVLHGLLTGNQIAASSHLGTETEGGYLVTPQMSASVVDLARSASVVMRAGARTLPMNTNELTIVRQTADPTAIWRPELGSVTASNPTFDKVTLRSKTVAAIVPVSIEMLEDASNARTVIENALRNKLGLELDQAVLSGSGAEGRPTGILNASGVNEEASVGTPTNYDELADAIGDIYTANFPGDASELAWVANPRDLLTYTKLKATDNQPLQKPDWVRELLGPFSTTSLAASGGETSMIVGDFSQVVVGMRYSGVVIDILNAGSVTDAAGDSFNAVSQLMMYVRARMRMDVAVLRPTWLTKLTGVTSA